MIWEVEILSPKKAERGGDIKVKSRKTLRINDMKVRLGHSRRNAQPAFGKKPKWYVPSILSIYRKGKTGGGGLTLPFFQLDHWLPGKCSSSLSSHNEAGASPCGSLERKIYVLDLY